MTETRTDISCGVLENAFSELVRQAVRAEVQDLVRATRDEDRLLTIDQVAQRLSVSKDWVYRNGKRLTFTKKLLLPGRTQNKWDHLITNPET
jgi:predicted DNA-binding transcriptional regulator AlpA